VVAVALIAVISLACTPERTTSQPGPRAAAGPGSSPAAPSRPTTDEPGRREACRARQGGSARFLQYRFTLAYDRVAASLDGSSAAASGRLREQVDRSHDRVREECATAPAAMNRFVDAVHRLTVGALDRRRLHRLTLSYLRWSTRVGAQRAARDLLTNQRSCRELRTRVRMAYSVRWRPTAYGKDMWLQMIAYNDTGHRITGTLDGDLWATRLHPRLRQFYPNGPRGSHLDWGGSSADFIHARPHSRATTFVGIGDGYLLHMRRDGYLHHIDVDAAVDRPGSPGPGWCGLPVRREQ
jgi:hypothetical protein